MKILESTTLIAIIKEIDCPDIINSIFKLNHKLIIPSYVYNELIDSKTKTTCDIFIKENKLTVSNLNSITEIIDLQKTGIVIDGKNKWKILIQNASLN